MTSRETPSRGPDRPPSVGTGVPTGRRRGFGPFVTLVEYERPDGLVARWDSRRQRKHAAPGSAGGTWWAPQGPGVVDRHPVRAGLGPLRHRGRARLCRAVGVRNDSITFFVGSVFFTSAGFLQYLESVAASGPSARGWGRVFAYRPRQIDWWASGIQLVGTVLFNISTATAIRTDLSTQAAHHHIWRPDALGSVCFLVASGMAWFEVCHGWTAWSPGDPSWWIVALNLTGSIAFGASAVAAYIVPSTGQLLNVELSNLGTFVGALCFLAGAVLLLPERTAGPAVAPP